MSPKNKTDSKAFPGLNISFLKQYVHNWLYLFPQGMSVEKISLYRYRGVGVEEQKTYAIVIEVSHGLEEDEIIAFEELQANFAFLDTDTDESCRLDPELGIIETFRDVYYPPPDPDYQIAADWTIIPIQTDQDLPESVDRSFSFIELYSNNSDIKLTKPQKRHIEMRQLAKRLWNESPMTIPEMTSHPEMMAVSENSSEKTVRRVVGDLNPNHKGGRRKGI